MKKMILAVCLVVSGAAVAQVPGLKPGLWEVKPIRHVVDGRDVIAAMAANQARMQQAFANLPPEQRKQMEAQMGGQNVKICITPAVAAHGLPMVDPEGTCQPETVERSGDKTSFAFHCSRNGRTSVGKGEATGNGDTIHTRVDMTTTDAKGSHSMQSEGEMTYLGADCQGLKPVGQMNKE
jgi:hypothetical protein